MLSWLLDNGVVLSFVPLAGYHPLTVVFNQYQSAYNDIFYADENKAIPKAKCVQDFLSGINDPLLQSGIDFILSDAGYLTNFEQTQQYLGTLMANRKQHNESQSDRRGVASASSANKDIKVEDRWYPINEWKELSD